MVGFLNKIPMFSGMPDENLKLFCQNMTKKYLNRNHTLLTAGSPLNMIYIVKKGEFELSKPLVKNHSNLVKKMNELMGGKTETNSVGDFIPEMTKVAPKDLPASFRVTTVSSGSILGEDDLLTESSCYNSTIKCITQRAKIYYIPKEFFKDLKSHPLHYVTAIKQVLSKNARINGDEFKKVDYKEVNKHEAVVSKEVDATMPKFKKDPVPPYVAPEKRTDFQKIIPVKEREPEAKVHSKPIMNQYGRKAVKIPTYFGPVLTPETLVAQI